MLMIWLALWCLFDCDESNVGQLFRLAYISVRQHFLSYGTYKLCILPNISASKILCIVTYSLVIQKGMCLLVL